MKKWLGMIAITSMMFAGSALAASIVQSKHDLGTGGDGNTNPLGASGTGSDRVCVFCHTPHNTRAPGTIPVPLWNRQDGATAASAFTMYDSATPGNQLDMTVAADPQGTSLVCLGCHDGVSAFDNMVNDPGISVTVTNMNALNAGAAALGTDLQNDHPISLTYDETVAGAVGEFVARTTVVNTLPLFGASSNQLECATCHAVHDPANVPFLRVSNTASGLCLTCHIK